MNWADWTVLGIIVVSCLIGVKRGFVKEALSLVVWILAMLVSLTFRENFAVLLEPHIQTLSVRQMSSFGILFALTLIVGAMANYLLSELVRLTGLSGTDLFFGTLFGLFRGFVVVMAILLFIPPIISVDQDLWWKESMTIPMFLAFEDWFREFMDSVFRLFSRIFN
jgi:membrane protein required for colicin V production